MDFDEGPEEPEALVDADDGGASMVPADEGGARATARSERLQYPRSLPYACETLEEIDARLEAIAGKLLDCVAAEDLDVGLVAWTQQLRSVLALKYPMQRRLRARLARFFYELAVTPSLDVHMVELAARMCIQLLRPKKALEIRDMELPWRPLYDVLQREIFHKQRMRSVGQATGVLLDLAEEAQRFYPSSEAEAMLEAMLPRMDGTDLNSVVATQALLVHFLPLADPQRWLPAMFRIWESFRSALVDDQMLDLLARLAREHVERPGVREDGRNSPPPAGVWRETGIFTDAQFALIMTKCLRSAGVPVGANKAADAALMAQSASVRTGADAVASSKTLRIKRPSDRLRSFATILVYSMAEDVPAAADAVEAGRTGAAAGVGGSKALTQLAALIQATETFFHPSNWGMWQVQLATLVQHTTYEFVSRCKQEERENCATPAAWRITPAIKRALVETLRGVCLLTMFAKDPLTTVAAQGALRRLAFLHPELVVPPVLHRSYSSLEALETTHRTTAVITTLSALMQPLLSRSVYPSGARHLVPLLHLCLPGIDPNDPIKTVSTAMLVMSACMGVVLEDGSEGAADAPEANEQVAVDEHTSERRADADYAVQLASADMEPWATAFLERVLHLFDMLPDEGKNGRAGDKHEEVVLNTLLAACDVFCTALGGRLYERCLDVVATYAAHTVSAPAVKAIGALVACFARADPERALARFVPLCSERIAAELAHGASSVRTTSTSVPRLQDAALHWYTSILTGAVTNAGEHALPHAAALRETLARLADGCRTERGYWLAARLLQRLLSALVSIYPRDQRLVNAGEWRSPAFAALAHQHWGRLHAADDVEIEWHVPSGAEVDLALALLAERVEPAIGEVERLVGAAPGAAPAGGESKTWLNDFCRHLTLVRFAYNGVVPLLSGAAPDGHAQPPASDMGAVCEAFLPPPFAVRTGSLLGDAGRPADGTPGAAALHLHMRVGDALHAAARHIHLGGAEDQIDAARLLIRTVRAYLVPHGGAADEFKALSKSVSFFLEATRVHPKQTRFPRMFWVRRAALYHATRMRLAGAAPVRTARADALLEQLLELTLSPYVAVRRTAQSVLDSVCTTYRGARARCVPRLVGALRPGAPEEHVKGALHMLGMRSFLRVISMHPASARSVAGALLAAQSHARPSVQKLVRALLADVVARVREPLERYAVFPRAELGAVQAELAALVRAPRTSGDTLQAVREARRARVADAQRDTDALLDNALAVARAPGTHWAYAIYAVRLLRAAMRRDVAPDAALASHLVREAVSENPTMRRHAHAALAQLLYLVKLRTLSGGNVEVLCLEQAHHPLRRTAQLPVPVDEAYAAAYFAAFSGELAPGTQLRDKGYTGWLVWPHTEPCYEAPAADVEAGAHVALPSTCEPASRGALEAVRAEAAAVPAWWERLATHLAQEKERHAIASDTVTLLKALLQILGPDVLPHVQAQVDRLVGERDRHPQRAAAELVAGVYRGAKHWPLSVQAQLGAWTDALFPRILAACSPDSQAAWESCVENVFHERDPRRARTLLAALVREARAALEDGGVARSAWQQTSAQQLLGAAVRMLQRKFAPWGADEFVQLYARMFDHDHWEVRRAVCEVLVEQELSAVAPAWGSVQALLHDARCAGGPAGPPTGSLLAPPASAAGAAAAAALAERMSRLTAHLEAWRAERTPLAHGTSRYDRAALTCCTWLVLSLEDHRVGPACAQAIRLLPHLFAMYELRDDAELSAQARSALVQVASYPYDGAHASELLYALLGIVRGATASWRARLDVLPFLQIVYFQKYVLPPPCRTAHPQSVLPGRGGRRCRAGAAARAAARPARRGARDGGDYARRRRPLLAAGPCRVAPAALCTLGRHHRAAAPRRPAV